MADPKMPPHEPPFPRDEGTGLRALLDRLRDECAIVFTEGGDHLALQPRCVPNDALRSGVQKHHRLFLAMAKNDEDLNEEDRRTILRHDVRTGFQAPNDWPGALRELRQRCGMYTG